MPSLAEWRTYLYSDRREYQLRAARALLEHEPELPLQDLLFIFDKFFEQGLGAATERALLRRADRDLVAPMLDRLAASSRFQREAACRVLGSCGDFTATPHLLHALCDPVMIVRRAAGFALAQLRDQNARSGLEAAALAAASDDANVQWAIASALRALGEPNES